MVPSSIKLESKQFQKFKRFREFVVKNVPEEIQTKAFEEDCCPTSPYSWHVHASGLGDVIYVNAFGHVCNLTIDDDNQMFKDEWDNGADADSL